MKKIIKSVLFLLCSVCLFTACDEDRDGNPTITQPTSFVLNTPSYASSLIDLETTDHIRLTWSQPDYGGFPVAANYIPQISLTGNFTISSAQEDADETGETKCDYVELNSSVPFCNMDLQKNQLAAAIVKIAKWESSDDVPAQQDVYIRMKSEFSEMLPVYSNTIKLTVIPTFVEAKVYAEFIYMMGNFNSWTDPVTLHSPDLDGKYQCYNWLDGGFKFRPNQDNWNDDFGQDPNGSYGDLVTEGEEDCNDPGKSFPNDAKPAGFYQIDVDMETMKWSITAVESISIIGTVNGNWDTDTQLTYNSETGAWEVTTALTAGEMKFRMNNDWTTSWGGTDSDTDFSNLTQNGGKNLTIAEAGTYKVQLFITYEGNNKVVLTKQ